MKRPNLQIIGTEEEGTQVKVTENIFSKVIGENFSNLKKEVLIGVQEAHKTLNRYNQKKISHYIY